MNLRDFKVIVAVENLSKFNISQTVASRSAARSYFTLCPSRSLRRLHSHAYGFYLSVNNLTITITITMTLYSALDPSVSQRVQDTDDELFSAVMANSHHVLHHMLPDRTSHPYTLRPRRHDCSLTVKEDSRNFVIRLLFKDMY